MKKQQTKTMKLVKLKRSIMPPPTKGNSARVNKKNKNIRNTKPNNKLIINNRLTCLAKLYL